MFDNTVNSAANSAAGAIKDDAMSGELDMDLLTDPEALQEKA
jgi:hypothetical protein